MSTLRLFRHGPLLFWLGALLLLLGVSATAWALGESPGADGEERQTNRQVLEVVEGWRASLSQMPVAMADGSHREFAAELAAVAGVQAQRSTEPSMVDAWNAAAAAAEALTTVEPGDSDALLAGLHGISLAGDRLAMVVSGGTWVPAPLPRSVPVGPLPALPPNAPGPAGPGAAALPGAFERTSG